LIFYSAVPRFCLAFWRLCPSWIFRLFHSCTCTVGTRPRHPAPPKDRTLVLLTCYFVSLVFTTTYSLFFSVPLFPPSFCLVFPRASLLSFPRCYESLFLPPFTPVPCVSRILDFFSPYVPSSSPFRNTNLPYLVLECSPFFGRVPSPAPWSLFFKEGRKFAICFFSFLLFPRFLPFVFSPFSCPRHVCFYLAD